MQKVQQELWTKEASLVKFLKALGNECEAVVKITYNPAGSGAGLKEFGFEGTKLEPSLGIGGKLDGFIGTDDPPTKEQITSVLKAGVGQSESNPVVIAPVAAPIAMIVHLPAGCELEGVTPEPEVKQAALEEFWRHKGTSWEALLKSGGAAVKFNGAASC
ncbi:MAG: hypothetical protein WA510_19775, partial [Acidobacteriaceae bacterium]